MLTENNIEREHMNLIEANKVFDAILDIYAITDADELLEAILDKLIEMTNADSGTVYTFEDDQLHFKVIKNKTLGTNQRVHSSGLTIPPIKIDRSKIDNVSAYSAIYQEIIHTEDAYHDTRFNFEGPKAYDEITGYRTKSMLTIPLTKQWDEDEPTVGVIQLINETRAEDAIPFERIAHSVYIKIFVNIAANILVGRMNISEINALFRGFISIVTAVIDEKSKYTNDHTQNVTKYSLGFANYLNTIFEEGHKYYFSAKKLDELHLACLLHDIGKLYTPIEIMDKKTRLGVRKDPLLNRFFIKKMQLENALLKGTLTQDQYDKEMAYLDTLHDFVERIDTSATLTEDDNDVINNITMTYTDRDGNVVPLFDEEDIEGLSIKRGTLTPRERKVMEDHVVMTEKILESIENWRVYKHVKDWASNHHEFLDGTGYPKGLKGNQISIETRLITIVDIYEALTASNRPYKKPMSKEVSLGILKEMADSGKLEVELVRLFEGYVDLI